MFDADIRYLLYNFAKTWDVTDSLTMINIWDHGTCFSCGCSSISFSGSVSAFALSFSPLKLKSSDQEHINYNHVYYDSK